MSGESEKRMDREREADDRLIDWGLRANVARGDDPGARPSPELTDRILGAAKQRPTLANGSWLSKHRNRWLMAVATTLLLVVVGGSLLVQWGDFARNALPFAVVKQKSVVPQSGTQQASGQLLTVAPAMDPATVSSGSVVTFDDSANAFGGSQRVWMDYSEASPATSYGYPVQLGMEAGQPASEGFRAQVQTTNVKGYAIAIPEQRKGTENYTVTVDGKNYTVKALPETRTRTESYAVNVPMQQEASYTVQVPEQRTNEEGEVYTVMVPAQQTRQITVMRTEQRMREVHYVVNVPRLLDENGNAVNFDIAQNPELAEVMQQMGLGGGPELGGDKYDRIHENPFVVSKGTDAVSTFSIDVDTASYSNVRQYLKSGQLPPADAVRLEELVNYFDYDYAGPDEGGDHPFATHTEVAGCPWNKEHRLVRVAIKGREIEPDKRPLSNLVFLIDVSGSMNDANKLPLVVEGLSHMTQELGENDRVSIVVYAGSEGLALPPTRGDQQEAILEALGKLSAGGSTAGGAGIKLAYKIAEENFIKGGTNRVMLCTDGDFNVGVTSTAELERLAEEKAKDTEVFLTVLGFGRGNLNDAMMETISNRGNGNYHYIDNLREARRVLVQQLSGTLVTIAKDVKIQVEFNPANVAGYRLLGYENRMLARQDFNDDTKDAGEVGAGHTVTALYEVVPAGVKLPLAEEEPLKYQKQTDRLGETRDAKEDGETFSDELLTVRLRYKLPDETTSTKIEEAVQDKESPFRAASEELRFASSVAGFGMLLRDSEYKGNATFGMIRDVAAGAMGNDARGYRAEFLDLVEIAQDLSSK